MSPYTHLLTERHDGVLHLVLNRPAVRNAFNEELIGELHDWAEAVTRDAAGIRVVVLSGAGKAFCAGADLGWMGRTVEYSHEENLRDAHRMAAMTGFDGVQSRSMAFLPSVGSAMTAWS